MRPGAAPGAAAVYHGCRGGRGGRLILQRAHKKRAASLQSVKEQFFAHHLQWVFTSLFLQRSALYCSLTGCAAVREGQAKTLSCSSMRWSCAGAEKQGGCKAGGLPPASCLLKGTAAGNRSGHS